MKHPKTVYIHIEHDHESEWLLASANPSDAEHGDLIGVYDLREVLKMEVKRTLVTVKTKARQR